MPCYKSHSVITHTLFSTHSIKATGIREKSCNTCECQRCKQPIHYFWCLGLDKSLKHIMDDFKCSSLLSIGDPATQHNLVRCLRTGRWSRVDVSIGRFVYSIINDLIVSEVGVGLVLGQSEQLPHRDPKSPHVRLLREHPVETLSGHPANREDGIPLDHS